MATVTKSVTAQWPLVATFEVNVGADAMVNTSGVLTNFKAASGTVYDIFTPPVNSQVIGGDLVVRTISNESGTATVAIGDSGSATRYLGATNIKAAARTALVPTGYLTQSEGVRITIANQNGDATAGLFAVTVLFIIAGGTRASENLKTT